MGGERERFCDGFTTEYGEEYGVNFVKTSGHTGDYLSVDR